MNLALVVKQDITRFFQWYFTQLNAASTSELKLLLLGVLNEVCLEYISFYSGFPPSLPFLNGPSWWKLPMRLRRIRSRR